MSGSKELRQQLQRVADLVREIEEIADPKARAAARELVQTVTEVHGAALERILDRIFQTGDCGQRVIDELGTDPLVSNVLVLHGLHPDDLETRVCKTLRHVAADLRAHGVDVELISVSDGAIRLNAKVGAHAFASTSTTARKTLEEAIYEAAPDMTSLTIEGLDTKPASNFIALEKLLGSEALSNTSTAQLLRTGLDSD